MNYRMALGFSRPDPDLPNRLENLIPFSLSIPSCLKAGLQTPNGHA